MSTSTKYQAPNTKQITTSNFKITKKFGFWILSIICILGFVFWNLQHAYAASGINKQINFQGKLVDNTGVNVADNTYSVIFSLYNVSSGGSATWTETDSVTTSNGIFQVALGGITSLPGSVDFNTDTWYLGIKVGADAEMTPRVRLAAVPYAFNASTVNGLTFSGTSGNTYTLPSTNNGTILTSNAPTQSITSTQTSGSILGISDSTTETAATTGLSITMSGTGAFDQTGLSFNLSGATGTNLNDIVGTGSTWKISRTGALTVASCSGCSGAAVGGLNQVPTSNTAGAAGANVVAPTAAGIVGMTINGTNNSSTTADALDVNSIPATGLTATNGLLVQQNGAGTTTNGIQIQQTSGTLTNGLTFSGTFTNLINATNFSVTNAGLVNATSESITPGASTTGFTITQNNVPTVDIAQITNLGHTAAANGVNALQITFDSGPTNSTDQNGGLRVNINNKGTGAGQSNGIRIVATGAGTGVNSNTVGLSIDALSNASNVATGENAMQIGSGWDNAISAAGNIELEAKTNTAATQDTNWTNHTVAAGRLNTTTGIASISASAVYNGSLYVGTFLNAKAEVYRYGGSGTSWTALNSTPGTLSSTSSIDGVTSMAVYNGYLYVGTGKGGNAAEIYRYDGGSTFTSVMGATPGTIGGVASIASVSAMTVWNGDLYAGVCKTGAAEIFKYQGGTTWLPVSGAGTIATTTGVNCITSLVSYENYLIAGSAKPANAEVYRYTGGTTWIRLAVTGGFTLTSSGGTAPSAVDAVTSMTVYDGHLVVGLRKPSGGDVVEYVDNIGALAPTNDWARLNNASGTIVSGGNTINGVSTMAVYNGRLYIGTEASNGAEIFRYDGGEIGSANWTKVSQTTKGTIAAGSTANIDMVAQLLQYNNDFWAGTYEPGGAEMYSLTVVSGQSYALKFHASATQAEQSGLQNLGSISFVASPSANVNSAGGGTGAFVFSNTIETANGAYDVAEDYPTRDNFIGPGDLVAIDTKEKGLVKRSDRAHSTTVIGVYSAHPGFDLSQDGNLIDGLAAIPVALVGRVPVNVSSESGAIQAGDYITSSSIPGVGMKATTAGPIIGQALESYDGAKADTQGVEQILVFVSHGYYNGISQNALAGLSGSGDLAEVQFIGAPQTATEDMSSLQASESAIFASPSAYLTLNTLSVNGLATISGELRVEQNALVEGVLHVIDTIFANNFIVNGLSEFFGNTIFHGDVTFEHAPTFSQDTAGYASIHKGDSYVNVSFTKSYGITPVVNATLVVMPSVTPSTSDLTALQQTIASQNYAYVITNVTESGFTILLSKPAVDDMNFSWNALVVPSVTPSGQSHAVTTLQNNTIQQVAGAASIGTPQPSPEGAIGSLAKEAGRPLDEAPSASSSGQ